MGIKQKCSKKHTCHLPKQTKAKHLMDIQNGDTKVITLGQTAYTGNKKTTTTKHTETEYHLFLYCKHVTMTN